MKNHAINQNCTEPGFAAKGSCHEDRERKTILRTTGAHLSLDVSRGLDQELSVPSPCT